MNPYFIRIEKILFLVAVAALLINCSGPNDKVFNRDSYLLLDSRIIEDTENAVLKLGAVKKHPANPLFGEDKPWEPRFDNVYASVIYDEGIYKCWYNPFIVDERTTSVPIDKRNPSDTKYMDPLHRVIGLCYAYSEDGITWIKPELGLIEFEGSKANNLVMNEPHGVGVFLDEHETDPDRRYKAFFSSFDFGENKDMTVAFSPDGIHWSEWVNAASIKSPGDTHNNAFWDPYTKKYMGYTRSFTKGAGRVVTYTESKDFINWTEQKEVFGIYDGYKVQAHDMIVFPTGGVYVGLLGTMVFPEITKSYDGTADNVKQYIELTWSPDGKSWNRINPGIPFIGNSPGPEPPVYGKMPYDWGTAFAATPLFLENETRIYYGACDWYFFDWRKGYLALATIRPDGWAGYEPENSALPAVITTKKLLLAPTGPVYLYICADVEENGYVKVFINDGNGEQVLESLPIEQTAPHTMVMWQERSHLEIKPVEDESISIKFELKNAKIYSFKIVRE